MRILVRPVAQRPASVHQKPSRSEGAEAKTPRTRSTAGAMRRKRIVRTAPAHGAPGANAAAAQRKTPAASSFESVLPVGLESAVSLTVESACAWARKQNETPISLRVERACAEAVRDKEIRASLRCPKAALR
ncbi:TPA: hypothetical protein QDB04_000031 [Burkholderia vietnamiensis]|nr:hypothetical protein [Burkholderia vietnamiensis]